MTPTVVALRTMATGVVEAELARLMSRLPDLDDASRAEVEQTLRRVADKLLHQPTVRVKELANESGAVSYAAALAELFALDPEAVEAVTRVEGVSDDDPTMTDRTVRIGTRASALARTQSQQVADALTRRDRPARPSWSTIRTEGDASPAPLAQIGGTGVFVSALREALLRGEVDLAVHSLKDLPTAPPEGIALAAVPAARGPARRRGGPRRPHPRRAPGRAPASAPAPRAGSPSSRALGLGIDLVGVRGNVDTRIGKVADGELDAVVLARAGLARLGRADEVTEVLDPLQVLPAPGQGALAVECRADDDLRDVVHTALDDADLPRVRRGGASTARRARGRVLRPGRRTGRSCGRGRR